MTNEEKARELADYKQFGNYGSLEPKAYHAAIDMAKWKDETTILFLEKLADGFEIRDRIVGIELSKEEIIERFNNFIEEQ